MNENSIEMEFLRILSNWAQVKLMKLYTAYSFTNRFILQPDLFSFKADQIAQNMHISFSSKAWQWVYTKACKREDLANLEAQCP